jgi:hypothetical protein
MTNEFRVVHETSVFPESGRTIALLVKSLSRVGIIFFVDQLTRTIEKFIDTTAIFYEIMREKSYLFAAVLEGALH